MGKVILSQMGGQEFRYNFSLLNMKLSFVGGLVRSFCLAGFPFFMGFYSKDFILSIGVVWLGFFTLIVFFFCCVVTVLYRLRFVFDSFCSSFLGGALSKSMNKGLFLVSLIFLFIFCVSLGSLVQLVFVDYFALVRGVDLLVGLVVIIFSLFLFGRLLGRKVSVFLSVSLIFMSWLRMGGVSHQVRIYLFYLVERTWFEFVGGLVPLVELIKILVTFDYHRSLKFILFLSPSIIFVFL